MKRLFYILMILVLFVSCQKKKVETVKPLNSNTIIMDSTKVDSIGERKSIHQKEWEEHRDVTLDSLGSE